MKALFIIGLVIYAAVVVSVNIRSGQIERRKTVPTRYTRPEDRTQIQSPEFITKIMEEDDDDGQRGRYNTKGN